jgi:plasmid maintenance system antidote protein VapI
MKTFANYHVLFLKDYLIKKQKKNSRFSLRKFAGVLDISPTSLSQILGQKKGISESLAAKIVDKLMLSEEERRLFLLSVSASHSRNSKSKLKSSLELASISKDSSAIEKSNTNVNQIVNNVGPFLLETQEVQNLINSTEIDETYRYKSSTNDFYIRILYKLKNKETGQKLNNFIQVIFTEKTRTGATVYFIQKSNGKFKTYFNNIFDGKHRVTSLVEANQNSTVLFNDDQLPVIPHIHFIHFSSNQHIIGKMEYTKANFVVSGTLVDYENCEKPIDINYRQELKRQYD